MEVKIRGLSYQNGIFYIGKEHVACAFHEKGKLKSWVEPINSRTLFTMMKQIMVSMPLWFKLLTLLYVGFIFVPKIIAIWQPTVWNGIPLYAIFYLIFGTHFLFPKQLKKYHGAEHKVFSDRGLIGRARLFQIKQASITNRYCSTNAVVIYFMSVIVGSILLFAVTKQVSTSLEIASYSGLIIVPMVQKLMEVKQFRLLRRVILKISYWLQVHVTTTEPDRIHLIASIESYRQLAKKEFPERLVVRRTRVKKEESHMAIVDVTVIPVGTESPSVSKYVAEIQEVLKSYDGKIKYQLTPMSTIIEGELPLLFEVIQAIHEVPFKHGLKRVATNIRIDDRRDKLSTMEGKLESVQSHLKEEDEKLAKADDTI
nr:MTH1187 family thiamine-binding protein [Halalkalibacter alkalisediminis]